jgi:hypothetical protein
MVVSSRKWKRLVWPIPDLSALLSALPQSAKESFRKKAKKKTGYPLEKENHGYPASHQTSATWLSRCFRTRGFPPPDYSGFGFFGLFIFYLFITNPNFMQEKNFIFFLLENSRV